MTGDGTEKGEEGREEGGEGGEGRGEEVFLVMWSRSLSALNPPLPDPLPKLTPLPAFVK